METDKSAVIDPTGIYRYRLVRTWDEGLPPVCWILLNPSTADAVRDDPTIRRIIAFSRSWNYGSAIVVNLFAFRATSPRALRTATINRIGEENDRYIREAATEAGSTIVAWGCHGSLGYRGRSVITELRNIGLPIYCLGLTAGGQPKHPLYIPSHTMLGVF